MRYIDIIIPVKNEAKNLAPLVSRINKALSKANINYTLIFIDDHSEDRTVQVLSILRQVYPIKIYTKKGRVGKAFSILEGASYSKSEYVVMLDADLQYPPEAIPQMFEKLQNYGVVVARRKNYHTSFLRQFLSKGFKYFFGKFLFNLNIDVQSGLKLFKKEIIDQINISDVSKWTLDLPLLYTAKDLGYKIGEVEIDFYKRSNGKSHLNVFASILEIGAAALKLRLRNKRIYSVSSKSPKTMLNAGLIYKGKRFITHTALNPKISAINTFSLKQKLFIYIIAATFLSGLFINPYLALSIGIAAVSSIYFIDMFFNLYLILRSLHSPPEIHITDDQLSQVKNLPVYSILCPLYKEARVIPHFIDSIKNLDYPKNKLDVQLLLEEDDSETLKAVKRLNLPNFIRVTIVPDSQPKTKPKACNFGLNKAKGEYLVIYDAEDRPERDQLKKAYLAFQKVKDNVVCLQAKLNYFNPHQNLLTRFFTAEYSLWFDIILPALQSIETNIPLGGTSNHFRTKQLLSLKGWDAFNVTEDCDLGVRLFMEGKKTAIINSYTYEEANSNLKNWIRQRSRWIKGYMQTFFVHNRNPIALYKKEGIHALVFQLTVGGKIAFLFINPILWIVTFSYFAFNPLVGPKIESLYSPAIFYMAVTSAVFGNFLYLYYYMVGCAKKGQYSLIKYIFLVPLYWLFGSIAAFMALYQLIFKPHYWEKTIHGFHLQKREVKSSKEQIGIEAIPAYSIRIAKIKTFLQSGMAAGGVLVIATILANFFNFLYNAYLGRRISLEEFGLVSLVGSFLYLSSIPIGALGKTVSFRSAFLLGKYNQSAKPFWSHIRKQGMLVSLIITILWLIFSPALAAFFKSDSLEPFIIFAPVWFIGFVSTVDSGFLTGNLKFKILALLLISESIIRFVISVLLVEMGYSRFVYASIPLSMAVVLLGGWLYIRSAKESTVEVSRKVYLRFPRHFYLTSVLNKISTVSYLSLDVILAKHFLSPNEAGQYALLALIGKMVFFVGSLFSQFINPYVSREEGAQRSSKKIFYKLLILSSVSAFAAYVAVGLLGMYSAPILFGEKVRPVISYLPDYGLAMFCFSVAASLISFYAVRRKYLLTYAGFLMALLQIIAISFYHQDLNQIVTVVNIVGISSMGLVIILHLAYEPLIAFVRNINDLAVLFSLNISRDLNSLDKLRILIFNWRDTKHVWAGGAEVYIHEIAKELVKKGHKVTIFCGNDGHCIQQEIVDDVQIIRVGGFYTVYIWAFILYVLRFRGKFDIIVDSENGVPFFTPLFAKIPVISLIHHVHQEVFMSDLKFPLSQIGKFLEGRLMPIVYRNSKIITVSNSSKEAIEKLGLGKKVPIEVVNPGVDLAKFKPALKSKEPSVLYLGRLKGYKSIETLIHAIFFVSKKIPNVKLTIAGDGESKALLERLALKLKLSPFINFSGKVTEKTKVSYLSKAWVMVQPSNMEGWGITTIEANASGTTVIASDVPGLRDSVKNPHCGILVAPRDVKGFAEKIELVLTHKKLRNSLEKQSLRWAQNFSWEKSADNFAEILAEEYTKETLVKIPRLLSLERN